MHYKTSGSSISLDLENIKFHEFQNSSTSNKYYKHQTVKSPQDASLFSDEYTWAVLDILRAAGPMGMTAQNVHAQIVKEKGRVSKSKIYGILKRVYQMDWVHRSYEEGDEPRHNSIKMEWSGIMLDDEYDDVVMDKEKRFISERLFPVFLEYLNKAVEDMGKDNSAKWLPEKDYCRICRYSHEAHEFFSSLLDIATSEFLESEEFSMLLKNLGFSEK